MKTLTYSEAKKVGLIYQPDVAVAKIKKIAAAYDQDIEKYSQRYAELEAGSKLRDVIDYHAGDSHLTSLYLSMRKKAYGLVVSACGIDFWR